MPRSKNVIGRNWLASRSSSVARRRSGVWCRQRITLPAGMASTAMPAVTALPSMMTQDQDVVKTVGIYLYTGRPWPLHRPTAAQDKKRLQWPRATFYRQHPARLSCFAADGPAGQSRLLSGLGVERASGVLAGCTEA